MSNRSKSFFFRKGVIPDDRLFFEGVNGRSTYRDVVGYSTRNERLRHWHYAISGRADLHPVPHFVIKGHVLFSNDGETIWASKDKLAKARRSQCKNWWNDEWRDRMLAVMTHLRDEDGKIRLPLAQGLSLELEGSPMPFSSDVSYLEPDTVEREEIDDYAFEEDDEESLEAEETSSE
jgi:hypothetical protein